MSAHHDRLGNKTHAGPSSAFHRYFRSNISKAVVLFALFLICIATYGKLRFYRDPVSIFFSEQHGYDRFYSSHREREAVYFARHLAHLRDSPTKRVPPKAGKSPQLCATFVTVARTGLRHQYLETSLASLVANLTQPEREAIDINVFFADPDPTAHPSYASSAIRALADEIITYPNSFSVDDITYTTNLAAEAPSRSATERKSIFDYNRAIESCLKTTNASYVAVFEDDVLFADGWLSRTLLNLAEAERMMQNPARRDPIPYDVDPGQTNSWLYLRLFNQERSTGWRGGTGFFGNDVPFIASAIAVPVLFLLLAFRRTFRRARLARALDGPVLAFITLIVIPTSVWLFFAAGKASLLPPSPGVREEFFGCCSQALVYNRAHAPDLAQFMVEQSIVTGGGRGDMLSKQFAWERGLARLSAYPMVVQHVGNASATGTAADEARRIWSMAFESFDARSLAAEHARLVDVLFPGDEARPLV